MTLSHIVAVAENDVIGVNNDLPWNIPEDMKFFREKTKGKALIMGRKTYESVGHPLPNRLNVIVTRRTDYKVDAPNVVVKPDLESAIAYCESQVSKYGEEIFIIGGGEIFKESMSLVDVIYLTRIHKDYPGDVVYPKVDARKFELVERRDRNEPLPFSFLTYVRKK
ncbi:MAG: dihydrofolate reductase [Calothrix sp. SM1_5_4]|nr:dihydrofolate reductase [Calothrix sp. SM1_5_4]